MREWLKWMQACPILLIAALYCLPVLALLYLGRLGVDRLRGLWLRYRYPKETTMNYNERRALAAKRLKAHQAGKDAYNVKPHQRPQQAMPEAVEARLIDRGLIAWWE